MVLMHSQQSGAVFDALEARQRRRSLQFQRVALVLGGPVAVVFMFGGLFLLADFVPPPAPGKGADEIAAIFKDRPNQIRAGLMAASLGGALMMFLFSAISMQLRRIEGPRAMFAPMQLVLGGLLIYTAILPMMLLMVPAFRPDMSAESAQLCSDLAWIIWVGCGYMAVIQWAVMGAAILSDTHPTPVIPRWVGYASIFLSCDFIPVNFLVFFHDGPFAWNGLISYWLAVVGYGLWLLCMIYGLLTAIQSEEAELDRAEATARTADLDALTVTR
jgi:hypothetical protein